MSVSACATDYYYGSVLAPALPDVDEKIYPYCAIYDVSPIDDIRLVYSTVPFAVAKKSGMTNEGLTIPQVADVIWYTLVDGVWQYNVSVTDDVAYGLYVVLNDIKGLWVNHDVYNSSVNVVFPSQKPTLANRTVEISDSLLRRQLTSSYDYSATSNYYLSYGANTTTNLLPVLPESDVSVSCRVTDGKFDKVTYSLWFLDSSGIDKVSAGSPLVSVSDYVSTGRLPLGTIVEIPDGTKAVWLELYQSGYSFSVSDLEFLYFGYSSVVSSYSPTITATTSNVTDTTVDLAINVTGMNPAKTYNVRIDGTTADGEDLSKVIGTITGQETYSDSATLGPFTPNTYYRATLVLVEDGVDVSSSLISFTTLPDDGDYNPQISAIQYSVTSDSFMSQVTMTGLNPAHTYKLHYGLYDYDADGNEQLVSSGYPPDFGEISGVRSFTGYHQLTDLTPNTDYLIQWLAADLTDNSIVVSLSNVEFTTLDDGSGGGGSGSSDDNSGILLMILNKVSAILDTMNGGQSEGILASINEKLDSLIATLANPAEQAIEQSFQETTQYVADNVFGGESDLKVTTSNIGDVASIASTGKQLFGVSSTVGDFLGLITGETGFAWFSEETKSGLTSVDSVSVAFYSFEDTHSKEETTWSKHEEEYWKFFDKEE